MIDWGEPEPDFIRPHLGVEIRTIEDAVKLIDQWREAEAAAVRAWARAHSDYIDMKAAAENARALADGYRTLYIAALKPENDDIRSQLLALEEGVTKA